MNQSDHYVREAVAGRAEIPQLAELQDPEQLVPLAATTLNKQYPEMNRVAVLLACREALRRLVNNVIEDREGMLEEFVKSEFGVET